jgi:hypothetical protein
MKVEYPPRFKELLDNYQSNYPYDDFIGCGNPNAKILIIGKENGIDFNDHVSRYRPTKKLQIEIKENFGRWIDNMENDKTRDDVESWFSDTDFSKKYNPIAPYNGQKFRGQASKDIHKTNSTYFAYQKFINHLLPTELQVGDGKLLNFYDYCFFTELSCNCKPMSGADYDPKTAESIKNRLFDKNGILRKPFFQEFPIIILACYHYYDLYHIEIEKYFNQKFIDTPYDEKRGNISEYIHRHISVSKDNKYRLLLHTNHFCMRSDDFIKNVADVCKEFIVQHNIKIY